MPRASSPLCLQHSNPTVHNQAASRPGHQGLGPFMAPQGPYSHTHSHTHKLHTHRCRRNYSPLLVQGSLTPALQGVTMKYADGFPRHPAGEGPRSHALLMTLQDLRITCSGLRGGELWVQDELRSGSVRSFWLLIESFKPGSSLSQIFSQRVL